MTVVMSDPPLIWHRTLPKPAGLFANLPPNQPPTRYVAISDSSSACGIAVSQHSSPDDVVHGRTERNVPELVSDGTTQRTQSQAEADSDEDVEMIEDERPPSQLAVEIHSLSTSPRSNTTTEGQNQFCLCQPDPRIPRPRNAFILFRQHHQATVVAQNPGLTNPEVSKIIGEQWQHLHTGAKEEWKALAEEEKARHQQQYPDYRYQPRRHGRHNNSASVSGGLNSTSSTSSTSCQKCGGKTMNIPIAPYNTAEANRHAHHPTSRAFPHRNSVHQEPQSQHRPHLRWGSPPPSARHPPGQAYSTAPPPLQHQQPHHEPRARIVAVPQGPPPTSVDQVSDKRRRRNGEGMYVTVPAGHVPVMMSAAQYEPSHQQVDRQHAAIRANSAHFQYQPQSHSHPNSQPHQIQQSQPQQPPNIPTPRTAGITPTHLVYAPQQSYPPTAILPPTQSHLRPQATRQDSDLTLPPLQTSAFRQAATKGVDTQKSGVEAMVMSIPVLKKIHVLGQVAPSLAAPGLTSPPHEVRGAIIAIEGQDVANVHSMTTLLADQLEREGKFAVRIFNGPLPQSLRSQGAETRGPSIRDHDCGNSLTSQDILDTISQWHNISREMVEHITTRPREELAEVSQPSKEDDHDTIIVQVNKAAAIEEMELDSAGSLSPKTTTKAVDSSSKAVRTVATPLESSRVYARIPLSAQQYSQRPSTVRPPPSQSPTQTPLLPPSPYMIDRKISADSTRKRSSNATDTSQPLPGTTKRDVSHNAIPIALVPKYQLTTVDLASVNMPITDAYSPLAHWQWLATLWRGCVGPDITIVIKGLDGQETDEGLPAGNSSSENKQNTTIRTSGLASTPQMILKSNSVPVQAGPATGRLPLTQDQAMSYQQQQYMQQQQQQQNPVQPSQQGPPPKSAVITQPGVEVRLTDYRAVIVRMDHPQNFNIGNDPTARLRNESTKDHSTAEVDDATWEKAKRRVAFEVEEYLRR